MRASALTRRTALLAAAIGALALAGCNNGRTAEAAGDSVAVLGRAEAPVNVTEYASVTCGACAAWDSQVWPAFKAKYVDTGLVKFELREMSDRRTRSRAGWLVRSLRPADRRFAVVETRLPQPAGAAGRRLFARGAPAPSPPTAA
jgi:hypothetical protein